MDYDEWMKDMNKYENELLNEICEIFEIDLSDIAIDDYRRGSVLVRMRVQIWKCYHKYIHKLENSEMDREKIREMNVGDQMYIKYKDKWYNATVSHVENNNGNGKYFQVRYNPLPDKSGNDPFVWNTEWFFSRNEAKRTKFAAQFYTFRNEQGEDIPKRFEPQPLAQRNHVEHIQINDHIFVKWGDYDWRRCVVFKRKRKFLGLWIKVKDLISGKTKALRLWECVDTNKISFVDMRE